MTKTTEQVIYEMLTESTGTNFLDSEAITGAFGNVTNYER